jgi:large subunit ribosomal protein L18
MRPEQKRKITQRRRWRIRKKLHGTAARPRMAVRFTERNIYVQFINDDEGSTLASASTRHKAQTGRETLAANKAGAEVLGQAAGEAAKAAGISKVIFDRCGARYVQDGKIDIFAHAATRAGLDFGLDLDKKKKSELKKSAEGEKAEKPKKEKKEKKAKREKKAETPEQAEASEPTAETEEAAPAETTK